MLVYLRGVQICDDEKTAEADSVYECPQMVSLSLSLSLRNGNADKSICINNLY